VASRVNKVTIDYQNCMSELTVLWKFSFPTMLSNMLVTPVTWICNAMLMNQPGGLAEIATYNIVTQWRQIMLFLPGVAAQVFLPIMTSDVHSTNMQLVKDKYLKINLIVTIPILFVMSFMSPLIMTLYGSSYFSQWPVFVIVQLATLAQIMQSPVVTAWASEGRMWTNLKANIFWATSLIFLSWLFIRKGALGLGIALFISFLLFFFVIFLIKKLEVTNDLKKYR
jgi:O-antigen/teichoic acid export membrane protein